MDTSNGFNNTPIGISGYSGHADAFTTQISTTCWFGCNLQLPIDYLDIWILN